MKPLDGKGQPLQASDFEQTFFSLCCGGLVDLQVSGPYHHRGLGILQPVPFLLAAHDCSLLSKFPNDNFLKTKKAGASESEKLPDTPACLENKLIIF